jgi:hypothetical protein
MCAKRLFVVYRAEPCDSGPVLTFDATHRPTKIMIRPLSTRLPMLPDQIHSPLGSVQKGWL